MAPRLRNLLDLDPTYEAGTILPMARHKTTGALSPALPGVLRGPVQGLLGLFDEFTGAVEGEGFDPTAVTEGALSLPAAGLLADVPAGVIGSNLGLGTLKKQLKGLYDEFERHRSAATSMDYINKPEVKELRRQINELQHKVDEMAPPRGYQKPTQPQLTGVLEAGRAKTGGPTAQNLLNLMKERDPERLQRAKDMGFDVENVYYHGTPEAEALTEFSNAKRGSNFIQETDPAHWLGSHPEIANQYTNFFENPNANEGVFPVLVRGAAALKNKIISEEGDEGEALAKGIADTRKLGKDVFITRDDTGTAGHVAAVENPINIRSIFAQFRDPESGDLLAANKGKTQAGISAGLLADPESRKPRVLTEMMNRLWKKDPERMTRAEEMGFDTSTEYFHGTTKDPKKFDPNKYTKQRYAQTHAGEEGPPPASFFTDALHVAENYAGKDWKQKWAYPGAIRDYGKWLDENFEGIETKRRELVKNMTRAETAWNKKPDAEKLKLSSKRDDPDIAKATREFNEWLSESDYRNIFRENKHRFQKDIYKKGGQILPVLLNKGNARRADFGSRMPLHEMIDEIAAAKKEGFDSSIIDDYTHGRQIVMFDPKKIRSIFAQFRDPESSDLLAANRAPSLLFPSAASRRSDKASDL